MIRELGRLARIHRWYGDSIGDEKRALVRGLRRARLRSANEVARLHEVLAFLRAYPDDAGLLAEVDRALAGFERRADLVRLRDDLADSGIAGTAIRYRFFHAMALWLAGRWPRRLRLDREKGDEFEPRLRAMLPSALPWIEAEAVRRSEAPTFEIFDRLRGRATDAAFLLVRMDERTHDALDASFVLDPGKGGPSRTHARWEGAPIVFSHRPPDRTRPDLSREVAKPPAEVRSVSPRAGRALLDLAREAMVTRSRDLDAFSYGNPRDVRLVDDGGGLQFALIGSLPERRLPLPVVHGWLTLKNGVPIGYVQSDTLLRSTEIAFNTFETFRGAEAARIFGRVLAVARHVLRAESFSIEPYQLGRENAEGIETGAWWFYFKLGFRPKDREVKRVLARERARMRRDRSQRSDAATLERLASAHVYWEPDRRFPALLPLVPGLGLRLAPSPPDVAERAAARLGVRSFRGWTRDERTAWERLAPVTLALSGVSRWTARERRALVEAMREKGDRAEDRLAERLDAHPRAARALAALLTGLGAAI